MSGLRVGFAALRFFNERTGNVESLRNLVSGLCELGCEPSLLVPRSTREVELFPGVTVHHYSARALFDANIFAAERAAATAITQLADRFDVLQLQLPSPAFARFANRVRRSSGKPVVAAFESSFHHSPAVGWPKPGKTLVDLLLRRALNDQLHARLSRFDFDACVVASDLQRRELAAIGCTDKVHVLPNATVFDRFANPEASPDAALVPEGKKTVAYIGHFNFIKGVRYLVSAYELLAGKRDDVHLLVIGSGRGNESDAVYAGVRALGSCATLVERTVDVAAVLPKLAALALPYVASYGHQLYPNLVLEGMASGTPVVTSDIPPVNEIIREGETGFLARAGDPQALADALERAIDRPAASPARRAMIDAQQALVRERFDSRVVAERYLRLYKSVIA
jgi:glycosyltransferase involved in cell wall biosynthesis